MRNELRNLYLALIFISYLFTQAVFAAVDKDSNLSVTKNITSSKIDTTRRGGWLSDLTTVPSREEIGAMAKHVDEIMEEDKDPKCKAINPRLRKMIFVHFATYQHMVNHRSIYFRKSDLHRWSKMLGMLLKESSGDPTNVTSMQGRSFTTYRVKSDLKRWRKIVKLQGKNISFNSQTNFGLTQLSVDRLFVAFEFSKRPVYLRGRRINLNTATAIRRLLWFYQDFVQGRLSQDQDRIHSYEHGNPDYASRYGFGVNMALLLCGTNYMFYEGYHQKSDGQANLAQAMSSIAYCKIGDESGYGRTEEQQKCFAKWITLCPALNFDIAMLTPRNYFATRNAAPVCQASFEALLVKKPKNKGKSKPNSKRKVMIKHSVNKDYNSKPHSRIKHILNSVGSLIEDIFSGFKK